MVRIRECFGSGPCVSKGSPFISRKTTGNHRRAHKHTSAVLPKGVPALLSVSPVSFCAVLFSMFLEPTSHVSPSTVSKTVRFMCPCAEESDIDAFVVLNEGDPDVTT